MLSLRDLSDRNAMQKALRRRPPCRRTSAPTCPSIPGLVPARSRWISSSSGLGAVTGNVKLWRELVRSIWRARVRRYQSPSFRRRDSASGTFAWGRWVKRPLVVLIAAAVSQPKCGAMRLGRHAMMPCPAKQNGARPRLLTWAWSAKCAGAGRRHWVVRCVGECGRQARRVALAFGVSLEGPPPASWRATAGCAARAQTHGLRFLPNRWRRRAAAKVV